MVWITTKLFFDGLIAGSDLATFGAFAAILVKMKGTRSAAGLSLQSIMAILTLRTLHLCSHLWGNHYVPKAMWMFPFKVLDIAVVVAGVACVVALLTKYYPTYEVEKDNFGIQLFDRWDLLPRDGSFRLRPLAAASFLYVVASVLAIVWYLVRTTSTTYNLTSYTCFSEALSAVALLPQLWMFQHDKRVDSQLASFVVMVAFNRLCTLCFWTFLPFLVVHSWAVPSNRPIQMVLEVLNLLILADFLYYWARAKMRGEKDIILSSDCCV